MTEPLSFIQTPPELGNQYDEDPVLRTWLETTLPGELIRAEAAVLGELGERSGGEWYRLQQADRLNEPRLTQWSPWGERIDAIELTPLWRRARHWAAEYGLIAAGYDPGPGVHARTLQFARAWLFIPSTDFYGCPLAMTDGAARILTDAGNAALADRALPHLLARDGETFWTSGQWMTETAGGSDVSGIETVARRDAAGRWRLTGRKWFTSAATSEMALTLARPEGNPDGSRGLALFYVEPHGADGRLRNIEVLRLKDKLGTRKLPTAELWLDGTPAEPVAGLERGVAAIAPMLNLTRTWNAITACTLMRRGLALAESYARRRRAFGRYLIDQPLHRHTLALLEADQAAAAAASLFMVGELGRAEHGDAQADPALVRLLTPMVKLGTARDAVALTAEVVEAFGGAGYIEDTGIPQLLRDVQVLSIWEGTTNVLALDLLRAIGSVGLEPWIGAMRRQLDSVRGEALGEVVQIALRAVDTLGADPGRLGDAAETNARTLAMNLYRTTALTALAGLAARASRAGHAEAPRLVAVTRRFARLRFALAPLDVDDAPAGQFAEGSA